MHSIQKVSQNFVRLFNLILIFLPAFEIFSWIFTDKFKSPCNGSDGYSLNYSLFNPMIDISSVKWTAMTKCVGFAGAMIGLIPIIWGLFILRLLFKNYQTHEIFTLRNVQYYKQLGYLFFLHSLIAMPISDTVIMLAATLSNPPGQRVIQIGFGTPNLTTLFCGLLIIVISWVMNEGYKLEEEKQYTI